VIRHNEDIEKKKETVRITEVKKERKEFLNGDINEIEMARFFSSSELLKLVDKWKIHLLVIIGITAILAAIFSGPTFITPLFKSQAILYPANVESYSEESETEQMLQIFGSQDITDSIINKFDLGTHYEVDKNYKYYQTVLYYEYSEKVKISKTPYESVSIVVLDKDPDTAALIVEALINFYDKKVGRLHKSKYIEVVTMYDYQLQRKKSTIDSLKSILRVLGNEHGLIEYGGQSQEIIRGLLGTIDGDNAKIDKKEVDRLMESMQEYGGQLVEVVEMIQNESRAYVTVNLEYELAERFLSSDMTYSNIVSYPIVSDKKEYPVRWIIVLVASIAALVFSMLVIMFIENKKQQS